MSVVNIEDTGTNESNCQVLEDWQIGNWNIDRGRKIYKDTLIK